MTDSSGMRAGLKGNVEEALRLFAAEAEYVRGIADLEKFSEQRQAG